MKLDPSQESAVQLACTAPFACIVGGPGVGKTTTLRVALDRMDARGETYKLCAPTGKAARRMSESTGRPASTIHRLLGWSPLGFTHNRHNPIDAGVVVVDESSMLCVELCGDLMDAIAPGTRVIFVGDANQLPSVGPGRILADLVESNTVPVARLTHVHRQAAESWVCRNAPRILNDGDLELGTFPDFRFVEADGADQVARVVADLCASDYQGAQVLAPQRNTECGVENLNVRLQERLNPMEAFKAEWNLGEKRFRLGDRVLQTVNNYKLESEDEQLGVFNGEVGTVADFTGSSMIVDFGDRRVPYAKDAAFGLDLAYAMTVHKSQGSEFPDVVMVVHSSHTFMLTRQLFYTGITRAKKRLVIVGNRKGIHAATSGKKPPPRNTALVDRMRELSGDVEKDVEAEEWEALQSEPLNPPPQKAVGDDIPW